MDMELNYTVKPCLMSSVSEWSAAENAAPQSGTKPLEVAAKHKDCESSSETQSQLGRVPLKTPVRLKTFGMWSVSEHVLRRHPVNIACC